MAVAPFPFPIPETQRAMMMAAIQVRDYWVAQAEALGVSSAYINGLQREDSLIYPLGNDSLAAMIANRWRWASSVDFGREGFHLPSRIRWGSTPGSRRSARGQAYIIIPFTHRVRSIPRKIYAVALTLQPTQRLTAGPSQGQAVHAPGLMPYQPRSALNRLPGARASIYEGLRRRPNPRGRGSRYETFRTITPTSPGWHIPPRPALRIAQVVGREMLPQVQQQVEQAFARDVAAALQRQLGGTP